MSWIESAKATRGLPGYVSTHVGLLPLVENFRSSDSSTILETTVRWTITPEYLLRQLLSKDQRKIFSKIRRAKCERIFHSVVYACSYAWQRIIRYREQRNKRERKDADVYAGGFGPAYSRVTVQPTVTNSPCTPYCPCAFSLLKNGQGVKSSEPKNRGIIYPRTKKVQKVNRIAMSVGAI